MKHEIIYTPQCLCCKHYLGLTQTLIRRCTTFPEGIPDDLMFNKVSHKFEYPGD